MTRRGDRGRPGRTPVAAYVSVSDSDPFDILAAEHALLRRSFARLLEGRPDDGADEAHLALLASLSKSLEQHLRGEEQVLYPVCERLFGGVDGPAPVLREDHREIRGRLDALVDEAGHRGRLSRVRLDMLRLQVADHFGKEERVLFPLTRALLSGTESGSLARRLRAPPVR